jgi:hypothetical protein
MYSSAEVLKLIAENGFRLLYEKSAPDDVWVVTRRESEFKCSRPMGGTRRRFEFRRPRLMTSLPARW